MLFKNCSLNFLKSENQFSFVKRKRTRKAKKPSLHKERRDFANPSLLSVLRRQPPIVSLNRMVHLGRTRMHCIHCTVSFIQNLIPKPIHIWHTQPMIQYQNTIIQSESGYLTQLDSVDETQKLWIARLSLLYLLSQD